MTRVLSELGGFEVAHELDPADALRRVETEQWDLLITDIELPGMSGLELLERVRELVPDLPVAVITGHPSVDYAVSALRGAAAEFLSKPISAEDLTAKATEPGRGGPGGARRGPGDGAGHRGPSRRRGDRRGRRAAGPPGGRRHGGHPDPFPRGPRRRPARTRPRVAAGRRHHRRPAVPGRPGGHPHRRGVPDDQRHRRGRRGSPADHRLHPFCARRPPGSPQHQPRGYGRLPARRAGLLLPVPVGDHRVPPDVFRHHRCSRRWQAPGHRRVRLADRRARLPGARPDHRDGPVLVPVRRRQPRRAVRDDPGPRRWQAACRSRPVPRRSRSANACR